jgi:RNA polymerase sigma-70 factor (ECF subfamily)
MANMSFRVQLEDFAGFYADTYPGAYRLALGIVGSPPAAEDIVQDAYAAAYRQRLRFRGDVPASAWLHRIVVNGALSALRKNRPVRVRPLGEAEVDAPAPDSDHDLADALDALDGRSRAAIVLRYVYGYDYAAMSAILGISRGNVGMILTRALRQLRHDLLGNEHPVEPG